METVRPDRLVYKTPNHRYKVSQNKVAMQYHTLGIYVQGTVHNSETFEAEPANDARDGPRTDTNQKNTHRRCARNMAKSLLPSDKALCSVILFWSLISQTP
jgi:hypothetical protein